MPEIVGAVPVTFMLAARVSICPEASDTVTVKAAGPNPVGVPLRTPALDSDNPAGTAPSVTRKLSAPLPVAEKGKLYGTFHDASGGSPVSEMTVPATVMLVARSTV